MGWLTGHSERVSYLLVSVGTRSINNVIRTAPGDAHSTAVHRVARNADERKFASRVRPVARRLPFFGERSGGATKRRRRTALNHSRRSP